MRARDEIIAEIRRTASENNGKPLGRRRFETETGIREADWLGHFWARWGDAVVEAGFTANQLNEAYPTEQLLTLYAKFAKELGRLPTANDLRMRDRLDPTYPNAKVFERLGSKVEMIAKLEQFCSEKVDHSDVLAMCVAYRTKLPLKQPEQQQTGLEEGVVYLMKSGKHYKIGRTNSVGRREYELAIQLPERVVRIHEIRTDDTVGIEAYWHQRFSTKRKNGEWFDLNAADVAAFKRRKFM